MPDNRISLDSKMSSSIRKVRESSNLSQSALAKKARVPRARIKRIECNELATIDAAEYTRICKVLDAPVMIQIKDQKKSKKKKTAKRKASKKTVKRKASRSNIKTRTPTRRAIMRLLDEAGVLDMTLRELLN